MTWVDDSFCLQRQALSCSECVTETGSKTSESVYLMLINCFDEYDLSEQDLLRCWFTTDCGTNIITALEKGHRLDCTCHRYNTILRTAWDLTESLCEEAKTFRKSCHDLVRFAKQGNLQATLPKSLKADSPTRWNSFLTVLRSIQENYDFLLNKFKNQPKNLLKLVNIDRNLLNELITFLTVFKTATDTLEKAKTPTLHLVAITRCDVIAECAHKDNESYIISTLKDFVLITLKEKLILNDLHWAATVLDPSMKHLSFLNAEERTGHLLNVTKLLSRSRESVSNSISLSPEKVSTMFVPLQSNTTISKSDRYDKYRIVKDMSVGFAKTIEDEFQSYILAAPPDQCANPLEYWRANQSVYPQLGDIAKKIFAISASSAASEREFSTMGRIFEPRRSQLSPSVADSIMRVRSKLIRDRNQNN